MASNFASARRPPNPTSEAIRPVRDVVDEHMRVTWEAHKDRMAQYLIAYHLGVSPNTLIQAKQRWATEESLVRDRR